MESVSCPACGQSNGYSPMWKVPDHLWFPDRYFQLVRCHRCGFVYLNPRPDDKEMQDYYPDFAHASAPLPTTMPPAFLWRIQEIESRKKGGKLLDVGCGNGLFLAFAVERGWDGYGMDNSPGAIHVAKNRLGDRVKLTTLSEAAYPSDFFDMISLFEVLEHLPDVTDHLREIHRILKPGGWLCVSVPNLASLERWIFGKWWVGLDAPRHLQQFTPASLLGFLKAAGLQAVEVQSINADKIQMRKHMITYCQESLRYFLRDIGLYPPRTVPTPQDVSAMEEKQPVVWKKAIHCLEWMVFSPLCLLARALNKENTLWAWGRKS